MRRTPVPRATSKCCRALRAASLEQFDDARQTAGDVLALGGNTTGVERTHRQLGAGLADRLGGDDTDRLADFDRLAASGQRHARSTWRTRPSSCVTRCQSAATAPVTRSVTPGSSRISATMNVVADDRAALR